MVKVSAVEIKTQFLLSREYNIFVDKLTRQEQTPNTALYILYHIRTNT